jgi:hypothetical protein
MFPHGYFAAGFFPPGYFPPVIESIAEETAEPVNLALLGSGGVSGGRSRWVEDPRVKYVKHLRGYFSALRGSSAYEEQPQLEAQIDALTPQSSLSEISDLSESLQLLVQALISAKGAKALSLPPPPMMPPIIVERIGDEVRERFIEDDDDELLIMMLLQ